MVFELVLQKYALDSAAKAPRSLPPSIWLLQGLACVETVGRYKKRILEGREQLNADVSVRRRESPERMFVFLSQKYWVEKGGGLPEEVVAILGDMQVTQRSKVYKFLNEGEYYVNRMQMWIQFLHQLEENPLPLTHFRTILRNFANIHIEDCFDAKYIPFVTAYLT